MSDKPKSQSEILVDIAERLFTFGQSADGTPFALPIDGPKLAAMFRGGRDGVRAQLAATFLDQEGKPPSSSALVDALGALEGIAARGPVAQLHMRVARDDDGAIVVDLGWPEGTVAVIDQERWRLLEFGHPDIVFRRTALSDALPQPARGGDIADLAESINVTAADMPLVVAWAVSAMFPELPHPIVLLTGEQGTGKSMAARRLVDLVDPSTAPLRTSPRDIEQWAVAASGSWVVALDNVSRVTEWLSDALCRAATGDAFVRRRLYSNDDLSVLAYRRCVMLTSIDSGALRGDLAERLVSFELERLGRGRATEDALDAAWARAHPQLLGALFDVTARVLAVIDHVKVPTLPRMADFARVVAAVDQVLGTGALARYSGQEDRIAADVVYSDPIGQTLMDMLSSGPIEAPAGEILDGLDTRRGDTRAPRGWPKTPRALAGALKRLSPALRRLGVDVDHDRTGGSRAWILTPQPKVIGKQPSQPSRPSPAAPNGQKQANGPVAQPSSNRHGPSSNRHGESPDRHDRHEDLPLEPLNDGYAVVTVGNRSSCADCGNEATAHDIDGLARCNDCVSWNVEGGAA